MVHGAGTKAVTVAFTVHRLAMHRCRRGELRIAESRRQRCGLHVPHHPSQEPVSVPLHKQHGMLLQQRRRRSRSRWHTGERPHQELL